MDRGSSKWPGGPAAPAPYPHERFGAKYPPHEIGQHVLEVRQEQICQIVNDHSLPYQADVVVEATCPDSRLLCSLAIGFTPDEPGLASLALTSSTVRLTSVVDFGFGASDVEDLLGVYGAPVPIASSGLWGFQYSPTEEVEGMRARLHLESPDSAPKTGKWLARARWQALREMSELEWRDAVGKCLLLVGPRGVRIADERPG